MTGLLSDMFPPPPPREVFLTFIAVLDQVATQKLIHHLIVAQTEGYQRIHLMIQSAGGSVSDGICLYNFIRNFPVEVLTYNTGGVMSAATILYLGGHKRIVSPSAAFMLHRSNASLQNANAEVLRARLASLLLDDQRSEEILKAHLHLSENQWATHHTADLWLNADESIAAGLATEARQFAPPQAAKVMNVFSY